MNSWRVVVSLSQRGRLEGRSSVAVCAEAWKVRNYVRRPLQLSAQGGSGFIGEESN